MQLLKLCYLSADLFYKNNPSISKPKRFALMSKYKGLQMSSSVVYEWQELINMIMQYY